MTATDVRPACTLDLDALVALENAAFAGDRISRRSWTSLLASPSAVVLVARHRSQLVGAAVLLTRRRSSIARLYSIAVAPSWRRAGVGRTLVKEAHCAAKARACRELRLETRADDVRVQRWYLSIGFVTNGVPVPGYYEDGTAALRWHQSMAAQPLHMQESLLQTVKPSVATSDASRVQ